jgi:hypothetical protein
MEMTLTRIALLFLIASLALGISSCGKGEETKDSKKPEAAQPASPVAENAPTVVTTAQPADGITARAAFSRALTEGLKWQADAEPFNMFTSSEKGATAEFWLFDFQSRSTKTCTRFIAFASGGFKTTEASHDCRIRKAVAREFVDSPVAIASAVAAGMKTGQSVEINLRFLQDKALAAPRACWVISSDSDSDSGVTRAWCVDPATGAFVVRLSGYGGPVFE